MTKFLIVTLFAVSLGCSKRQENQVLTNKYESGNQDKAVFSIILLKDKKNNAETFFVWHNVFGRRNLGVYMQNGLFFDSLEKVTEYLESKNATVLLDTSEGLNNDTYVAHQLNDNQAQALRNKKLLAE